MRSSNFLINYLENTVRTCPILLLMSLRILGALSKPEALDISWSISLPLWSSKLFLGTVSVLLLLWQINIALRIQGRPSTAPTLALSLGLRELLTRPRCGGVNTIGVDWRRAQSATISGCKWLLLSWFQMSYGCSSPARSWFYTDGSSDFFWVTQSHPCLGCVQGGYQCKKPWWVVLWSQLPARSVRGARITSSHLDVAWSSTRVQ